MKKLTLVNNSDGTLTITLPEHLKELDLLKDSDCAEIINVLHDLIHYVQVRRNELTTGQ